MPKSTMNFLAMMKKPSAFLPLAMSLIALALVLTSVLSSIAAYGTVVHEADEGAVAHLWQLLIAGQMPILAFFAIKWLPRTHTEALCVLALQIGAALASVALVFFLHL